MTTTTRYTPLLLFEKERNDAVVVVVVVVGSIGVSFAFLSLSYLVRERDCREECRFELDELCVEENKAQIFFLTTLI